MFEKITEQMLSFVDGNPTCFHVVDTMVKRLEKEGFTRLKETEKWKLKKGGKYYVTRNDSSIISFKVPKKDYKGFYMMASHSDSPSFKIKDNPEMESKGSYVRLNVEKYGGMLCNPWFDRPLSIAGRVIVKEGNKLTSKLVNIDRDLCMIPSLAIHMDRTANDGHKINAQEDMIPLLGLDGSKTKLMDLVAQAAGVDKDSIISDDLFLYNRVPATTWGAEDELISASRLDDQECVYTTFEGFLAAKESVNMQVHIVFDNEEVGSSTKQGAASTFLKDTLTRINRALGKDEEDYLVTLAQSFMVSADNAHALHPNYGSKADPVNRPLMNKGIVIKYNANQKYTTDAVSAALFKSVCQEAKVPFQSFTNRSDMPGGSTLGNISSNQVAVNTVDIGLAQLAMHSPYESAGAKDPVYLAKASKAFYESKIEN